MRRPLTPAALLPLAIAVAASARAAPVALPKLPLAECAIDAKQATLWRATGLLDEAARRWARGATLGDAVARSGYTATALSGLRFHGLDSDTPHLDASSCRVLRDRALQDVGSYRRGDELWIVFAAPTVLPSAEPAEAMARRALQLVNDARAQRHRWRASTRSTWRVITISITET